MDRLACVDVPALPLQLLVRSHPDWAEEPAVVVDRDHPQGRILWVNERARACRVLPGLRYAAGLSLTADLRAGVVADEEIATGVQGLTTALQELTPGVEAAPKEPGVFWLDARGFTRLHPSLDRWAQDVLARLKALGFGARIAVGFRRFATYALAHTTREVLVLDTPDAERAAADAVALSRLGLDPKLREALDRLGVRTVGSFVRLPPAGLLDRYGKEAHRLHRLATGDIAEPLRPEPFHEPVEARIELEYPQDDIAGIVFLVKRLLDPLLVVLAERRAAVRMLTLEMRLDDVRLTRRRRGKARRGRRRPKHRGEPAKRTAPQADGGTASPSGASSETAPSPHQSVTETIQPAAPTLDAKQLLELVHLRIDAARLPAGVLDLVVRVDGIRATEEQLRLFIEQPRRDLKAAERAFARIRAEFGEAAVVHAVLRDGHLPEACFAWEPLDRARLPRVAAAATPSPALALASVGTAPETGDRRGAFPAPLSTTTGAPATARSATLVRRVHLRPVALPPRARNEPDGWLVRGLEVGPVVRCAGPYVVSGGWWAGPGVQREYHFLETQRGDLLWVYYDRRRRRWYLQGQVE